MAEIDSGRVAQISAWIDASYPPGLDGEAHLWRRVIKVAGEAGEVDDALRGYLGENPRKGQTHSEQDVIHELLDVAVAALGAVEYMTGNQGTSGDLLRDHIEYLHHRAGLS